MKYMYNFHVNSYAFGAYKAKVALWPKTELIYTCPVCGMTRYNEIIYERTTGIDFPQKKWPDVLACTLTITNAISDYVLHDMRENRIGGFEVFKLNITNIPENKPKPFDYWLISPTTTLQYELVLPPNYEKYGCLNCGMWKSYEKGMPLPKLQISDEKIKDVDWAFAYYGSGSGYVLCSERVVDLACAKKWTNCGFVIFGDPDLWDIKIQYEKSNWREILEKEIAKRDAESNLSL